MPKRTEELQAELRDIELSTRSILDGVSDECYQTVERWATEAAATYQGELPPEIDLEAPEHLRGVLTLMAFSCMKVHRLRRELERIASEN